MIMDSSIPWKNKYFLFKPFFSQVKNIFYYIYESTVPLAWEPLPVVWSFFR